ncbi:MAG: DUF4037 domain-containing protein [Spirochaetaceae bacterium]|jgi:hypothetical protein|nr:DUF4037 domain-containing protein [Spirochaetaceae bacterium]
MKYKTKVLADRFTSALSALPGVECISLNEAALPDTLDPYFALILDVFYSGAVPEAEERRRLYGEDAAAFETSDFEISNQGSKDRFLIGNLPVRLEYKATLTIDELVDCAAKPDILRFIKGTYGYYRLTEGEPLFSRSGWLQGVRERLRNLPDAFWTRLRAVYQPKMEHLLNDLGAAFLLDDDFNYLVSSALFIKTACFTLFCLNRRFEPSHRAYFKQVIELPVLPEGFRVNLESFLRSDAEITKERRYALAQLIARSIVLL